MLNTVHTAFCYDLTTSCEDEEERDDGRQPDMIQRRVNHSSIVINKVLYVIGGSNGLKCLKSIEMMDLAPRIGQFNIKA